MNIGGIFGGGRVAPPPAKPAAPTIAPLDKLGAAISAVAPSMTAAARAMWADALREPMRSSGILTAKRIAAFLGQVAVESGGFTQLSENLNYSAERLCMVWPSRFSNGWSDGTSAAACERNPERLANAVYCDRMGNGNAASGDGWTFRGAGLIQLTGRDNQTRFAASVKMDVAKVGDYLRTPPGAAVSACWFWSLTDHKPALNARADTWDIAGITRAINGGDSAQAARYSLSCDALHVLSS